MLGAIPADCRVCGCKKACGDKDQPRLHTREGVIPAASYSPTRSLVQYHRRWKA